MDRDDGDGAALATVDDIAYAAAISPRTFFRYFPTKEDVVIWDEYDPIAAARSYRDDPERLLIKTRLLSSVPEVHARLLAHHQGSGGKMLADELARQRGLPRDQFAARAIAAAFGAAVITALDAWQRDGGESSPVDLVERAIDALADALRELEPRRG